jgi:hypothetical protein
MIFSKNNEKTIILHTFAARIQQFVNKIMFK